MRVALFVAAGVAGLTMSMAPAGAVTKSTSSKARVYNIDAYSFAGGRDGSMMTLVQTGRSTFSGRTARRPFTKSDLSHAFAPWALTP